MFNRPGFFWARKPTEDVVGGTDWEHQWQPVQLAVNEFTHRLELWTLGDDVEGGPVEDWEFGPELIPPQSSD
jgi:hypothetical protein